MTLLQVFIIYDPNYKDSPYVRKEEWTLVSCGKLSTEMMKKYLYILLSTFVFFACSNFEQADTTENDSTEISTYITTLDGERAIKYFSKYMTLSDEQQSQIITMANDFQNQLQQMDSQQRMKNKGLYTIKFASKIIREVLTMEQAEKFVQEDPAASQLFGE